MSCRRGNPRAATPAPPAPRLGKKGFFPELVKKKPNNKKNPEEPRGGGGWRHSGIRGHQVAGCDRVPSLPGDTGDAERRAAKPGVPAGCHGGTRKPEGLQSPLRGMGARTAASSLHTQQRRCIRKIFCLVKKSLLLELKRKPLCSAKPTGITNPVLGCNTASLFCSFLMGRLQISSKEQCFFQLRQIS